MSMPSSFISNTLISIWFELCVPLFLCLVDYHCGKQVGSASHKQLTAAQILHRVRSLSGYSGDPLNIVYEVTFVFLWSLLRTIGFMHCSILFTYLFLILQILHVYILSSARCRGRCLLHFGNTCFLNNDVSVFTYNGLQRSHAYILTAYW